MKFTSTLLLCCLLYSTANSQQWKFTGNYSLGMPQQQMGKNIQAVHSLQAGLLYRLPKQLNNLSVGIELGLGTYAHKQVDQTFTFDNISTVVPVSYNSNTFNANVQARFHLLNEDRFFVIPYIVGKAGIYNLYSNVVIEDPDDPDGCTAIDRKNIIKDQAAYFSAGGGLQIDPAIFCKNKRRDNIRIDISAQTVRGGSVDYINTKHLMDAQDVPEPGAKAVKARFVNASTQHIHEHTVAQVYTSRLRLFEIRAGVTVVF